uniref:Peptidase M14 carboxypeptidase A domain-containing protein n=1 Tax=Meloidogyne incognita TaxID=6306 RepID=A0A914KT47_MELIC
MEEHLFRLREMNPRLISLYEIGRTHENRSIVTAKISARQIMPDESWRPFRGPAIWIDAGVHAREWIAPATAMILIAALVNGYNSEDVGVRHLVEHVDWYITPVLNPDGYEYSHTKNRMWRKNRRPAFCKQQYFNRICCSGVDLNRNFDWFWSITGSSADPCHETYHGPSAFSEPEKSVRDFLQVHPVKAFISLHSYSQLWLLPYGHKKRNYPEDFHTVQRPLALRAVKALERLYGTEYQVGSGADLLYEASGSSHDYAKGVLNIPFSFLVELRPQNTLHSTGFLLPEAEIMDTADETWEAIKIVADKMLERYAPLPPIETSRGKNLMGITSSTEIEGNEHCSTSTITPPPTTPTSIKTSSNTSTSKTTIKTTRRKNNKNSPSKPTKKPTTPTTTELPTNQTLMVNTTTETTTTTTLMTAKQEYV